MATDTALNHTSAFMYQPIHDNAHETRLLHVQPASSPYGLIECSLDVVQLDEATGYGVLIMEKHNPPLDHVVLCNDHLFTLTPHLYSELQRLMRAACQFIWVKDICVEVVDIGNVPMREEYAEDRTLLCNGHVLRVGSGVYHVLV